MTTKKPAKKPKKKINAAMAARMVAAAWLSNSDFHNGCEPGDVQVGDPETDGADPDAGIWVAVRIRVDALSVELTMKGEHAAVNTCQEDDLP